MKDTIDPTEWDAFQYRMEQCVDARTAYKIGNTFLYYLNYKPCCALGAAMFSNGEPLKLLALLTGVFREVDKVTFKLDFYPHEKTFLRDYRSLLTMTSLKRQAKKDHPLVIRIDRLRAKIHKIHKARGVSWVR